jgi:hypothetical protein
MAAWVMALGARAEAAFADPPAGPMGVPKAGAQERNVSVPMQNHPGLSRRGPLRPAALVRPRADTSIATFPGFRLLSDGRTQLFVELSRPTSVKERRAAATLTYVLRAARVVAKNNTNALITTHFATPVDRARLVPVGEDLALVVDLRADVTASYEVVATENGEARLEVTFPPARSVPAVSKRFEPAASPDAEDVAPSHEASFGATAPTDARREGRPDTQGGDPASAAKAPPRGKGSAAPASPRP